jgi:hypothetical protein
LGSLNEVKVKAYTYNETLDTWTQTGNEFDTGYIAVTGYESKIVTLSTTSLALLFSDNSNPITPEYYGAVLMTLSWDGTNFAQVGNEYTSMSIRQGATMCALASPIIIAASYDGGSFLYFKALSWDGTDWTEVDSILSFISWGSGTKIATNDTNTFVSIDYNSKQIKQWLWSGSAITLGLASDITYLDYTYHDVVSVKENSVQIVDGLTLLNSNYMRENSGSTFTLENSSDFDKSEQPHVAKFAENKMIVAAANELIIYELISTLDNKLDNYDAGSNTYYSDYDVIAYNKTVEPLKVEFPDGVERIWKEVNKSGYSVLLYMSPQELDSLIDSYKEFTNLTINGVSVLEAEFESTEIANDLIKLIINAVTEITPYNKNIAVDTTYSLNMNSGAIQYYTDFAPVDGIRDIEKVDVEWDDGTINTLQVIRRLTKEVSIFTTNKQAVIKDIYSYTDVKIDSTDLDEIETTTEELGIGNYKILVDGVTGVSADTLYVFPTSGNHLEIIDETPTTYDFYTDFDVMLVSENPDINTTKNQTGVNTPTKGITKEVKQVKFYLNETNAFLLKSKFELYKPGWSMKLNTVAVKEARPIEPTKIGVDLYEVIVDCLMDTTSN